MPQFLFFAALCLFVQVVLDNKFLGWLVSSLFYIAGFVLPALRLEHHTASAPRPRRPTPT